MQCGHTSRVRILYKSILKLHYGLPKDLKLLGDNYVKDEFRRHKQCNEQETVLFMNEWTDYALSLAKQLGLRGPSTAKRLGVELDTKYLDTMSDEQLYQLYELMTATQGSDRSDKVEEK